MKYLAHIKEGLLNLYFAKLRSMLALLGILVGTASVVAMVLGGQLATNEALKQFKSLGTDLLSVSIYTNNDEHSSSLGKQENLSLSQVADMNRRISAITQIAPYTQLFNPIFYKGQRVSAMVLGVTNSFEEIVKVKLSKGRLISTLDGYNAYCVIGQELYKTIKKISVEDPIGQQLQIGQHIFIIVGVAASWPENGFVYANIDHSVLVPLMASTLISKYAIINNIIMHLKPDVDISSVKRQVETQITEEIGTKNLNFHSAKELIAKMRKQSDILTVFLGLIGSVSLLVGGIGVMNIMLVSVMERRREIGIRLAVGAKRRDIGALFLMESVMLSLLGGTLGVVIGILIAYIIAYVWHWEFTLFLWPPIAGFSVSVAVGVFFGFYPAFLASKMDPIAALRTE